MKFIYIITISLVTTLLIAYFFIPNVITNIIQIDSDCKTTTLRRMLLNNTAKLKKDNAIDFSIILDDIQNPTLILDVDSEKIYVSFNNFLDSKGDNKLLGSYSLNSKNSFIKKLKNFYLSYKVRSDLNSILSNIGLQCQDKEKIYGGKISEVRLQDSTLIYCKNTSDSFPNINEIYKQIDKLELYASENGAFSTNFPMLNINRSIENSKFEFSIALPINKDLNAYKNITSKRMLTGGKFLMMEIKGGGFEHISKMEVNLENYLIDHAYNSPAIPFQSLVTNRMLEKDSTKWVTKLFYPIY